MSLHRDPNEIPSAVPTEYERLMSYAEYEALHPGEAIPGSNFDLEFTAIELALAETQDRLALIQRDDGNLVNGIVTADSLADDLAAQILEDVGVEVSALMDAVDVGVAAADAAGLSAQAAAADAVTAAAAVDTINDLLGVLDVGEIAALDGRVDALEAFDIGAIQNNLSIVTGGLAVAVNNLSIVTGDVALNTASIGDHETRIDALELGATAPEITADTTYMIGSGGDYATFTAAFNALAFTRIRPGFYVTLQMNGTVTEAGALVWSHPDSSRIVLDLGGANRALNLGGWTGAAVSMPANAVLLGSKSPVVGFYVPAGDTLVYKRDASAARTLTISAHTTGLSTDKFGVVMAIAGRTEGRYPFAGTPVSYGIKFLMETAGAVCQYALVGVGAQFGGDSQAYTAAFWAGVGSSIASTALQPVYLGRCTGAIDVSGEGASATATLKERIFVTGGDLLLGVDKLGLKATVRAKVDVYSIGNVTIDASGGFVEVNNSDVRWLANLKNVGVAGDPVVQVYYGRFRTSNTLDNNSKAAATGVILLSGPEAEAHLYLAAFSNPPASGTFKAIYMVTGAVARCASVTYGGTFASNKSNATSTWSATTGQILTN